MDAGRFKIVYGVEDEMRRIAAVAVSTLIFLSVMAGISVARSNRSVARSNRAGRPECVAGYPHLLAVDTQAQVYSAITSQGFREAFGCAYGQQSYRLGSLEQALAPESGNAELFTLGGSMVAYQKGESGYSFLSRRILVRNLRTGKWIHIIPTGEPAKPNPDPADVGIGPALAIVVKDDGAVAWIAKDSELSGREGPVHYQVHAVDETGSRVLAAGTNVDPKSLALVGSTLYWTQGGQAMSATLN